MSLLKKPNINFRLVLDMAVAEIQGEHEALKKWEVNDWVTWLKHAGRIHRITPEMKQIKNYQLALEIINSPLEDALKEEE